MKAQDASLPFTPVFSALVAIINTKLPQVGELVLTRVISQFKKSFKWNNKVGFYLFMIGLFQTNYLHFFVIRSFVIPQLLSSPISSINLLHMKLLRSKFLSSALNGQMTPSKSPSVSLRVGAFLSENSPKANATVLLERSDNSIEIAVGFTHEVGAFLSEISPKTNATVFERFRAVLNEGKSVNEYKI
jgi:pre-mRNA-splicing factor CWC22